MAWLGSPRTARIYRAQNSRDLDTNKTPILRVPGFSSCRDMCVHTSGRSLAYALWLCCALLLSSCPQPDSHRPHSTDHTAHSTALGLVRGLQLAKERKKENRQPKGGMGGRHAATTQGF